MPSRIVSYKVTFTQLPKRSNKSNLTVLFYFWNCGSQRKYNSKWLCMQSRGEKFCLCLCLTHSHFITLPVNMRALSCNWVLHRRFKSLSSTYFLHTCQISSTCTITITVKSYLFTLKHCFIFFIHMYGLKHETSNMLLYFGLQYFTSCLK